jgi:hypothetical protein
MDKIRRPDPGLHSPLCHFHPRSSLPRYFCEKSMIQETRWPVAGKTLVGQGHQADNPYGGSTQEQIPSLSTGNEISATGHLASLVINSLHINGRGVSVRHADSTKWMWVNWSDSAGLPAPRRAAIARFHPLHSTPTHQINDCRLSSDGSRNCCLHGFAQSLDDKLDDSVPMRVDEEMLGLDHLDSKRPSSFA